MSLKDWEKLNITRDEVDKVSEALKNEEFRKMFIDYCEEISDPENRKLYEAEITQLERERGVDVTFINPEPGYVIKTSSDGTTKTFLNIATNAKVDKPSSTSSINADGQRGLNWSLPYTLAPPRRDMDKKGEMCHVYDIVFHPDALHLASRNTEFRKLVNDTAIDAVQQSFNVQLDRANVKYPKLPYKGMAKPTVIRKKIDGDHIMEPSPIDSIYPSLPDDSKSTPKVLIPSPPADDYTIPKFKIVQRRGVEFHEMTHEIDAKFNVTIPSELVVYIDLPLLNTTDDVKLDVTGRGIQLLSEKPSKYRLDIALPYEVQENDGSAKFDKSKRQLIITMPVVPEKRLKLTDFQREDSGIESDHGKLFNELESESSNDAPEMDVDVQKCDVSQKFLDSNIEYILPNFTFNQIDEIMAFTLHVKNVDPSTITIDRRDLLNIAHIKFSSIGAGFFPIHYSFCVKFPSDYAGIFRDISAEAWDNNVIFQFELNNYEFPSYEIGLDDQSLVSYDIVERMTGRHPMTSQGKEIEDDSLSIEIRSDAESELVIEVTKKDSDMDMKPTKLSRETSNDEVSEDVFDEQQPADGPKRPAKKSIRKRNKKMRSMSESYCDQLNVINELDQLKLDMEEPRKKNRSLSESSSDEHNDENGEMPIQNHRHKYKSILKNSGSLSECCQESSMDERKCIRYSMSVDCGICESHDSLSESCKKTVRFSDIIKRQLFRSNTSILAQKKKNQKKKASRKRALDRRHSEGSESEKHDYDYDEKEEEDEEEDEDDGSYRHMTNDGVKPQKRDSGVDLTEKLTQMANCKIKNKKSNAEKATGKGADIQFKSGMIFDLEM